MMCLQLNGGAIVDMSVGMYYELTEPIDYLVENEKEKYKMIYIDIPHDTGKEWVYDKENLDYAQYVCLLTFANLRATLPERQVLVNPKHKLALLTSFVYCTPFSSLFRNLKLCFSPQCIRMISFIISLVSGEFNHCASS